MGESPVIRVAMTGPHGKPPIQPVPRVPLIEDPTVDTAWREVSASANDPERAGELFEAFAQAQGALGAYLAEAFDGLSPDAVELGYFASLVIWRALSHENVISEVTAEEIAGGFARLRDWLDSMASTDPVLFEKKLRDTLPHPQPHVLRYLVDAVFDAHEDGLELSARDQERLYLALRVALDTLVPHLRVSAI